MPGVGVQTGSTPSGLSLLRGQWPVSCVLEVPSPELCPLPCIPAERQCGSVRARVSPQVWKGYLQRKRTQQDRRTEMEFIGMVSVLPPALCILPSTEDCGKGVWGP